MMSLEIPSASNQYVALNIYEEQRENWLISAKDLLKAAESLSDTLWTTVDVKTRDDGKTVYITDQEYRKYPAKFIYLKDQLKLHLENYERTSNTDFSQLVEIYSEFVNLSQIGVNNYSHFLRGGADTKLNLKLLMSIFIFLELPDLALLIAGNSIEAGKDTLANLIFLPLLAYRVIFRGFKLRKYKKDFKLLMEAQGKAVSSLKEKMHRIINREDKPYFDLVRLSIIENCTLLPPLADIVSSYLFAPSSTSIYDDFEYEEHPLTWYKRLL